MPYDEYGKIGPEDLDKLRLIVQIFSHGSETYAGQQAKEYARRLADSITDNPAHEVANLLVDRPSDGDGELKDFARRLTEDTMEIVNRRDDLVA